MSCSRSRCDLSLLKAKLRASALEQGFVRFGVAGIEAVEDKAVDEYDRFISEGRNGQMSYLANYRDIRINPALLVPEVAACSVIAVAASYYTPVQFNNLRWARYALGDDYHDVIRNKLAPLAKELADNGFAARICVDTAPLRERYWAEKAGLGTIGENGLLLTDAGSYVLLGFIITDAALPADKPLEKPLCSHCGACRKACPSGALRCESGFDARRCNSYKTIEFRGEFSGETALGNRIYGCDICQEVCPVNRNPEPAVWKEFMPRPAILGLSREDILEMKQEQFSMIFRNSAIKRTKLAGLVRNTRI